MQEERDIHIVLARVIVLGPMIARVAVVVPAIGLVRASAHASVPDIAIAIVVDNVSGIFYIDIKIGMDFNYS